MTGTGAAAAATGAPGAGFSIRRYVGTAHGSHRGELDLAGYAAAPLDAAALDAVDTLARLELSALGYLRSVLVTPTHADAEMTAFLVTWAYEKYWLADALEAILAVHPGYVPPGPDGGPAARLRRVRHSIGERIEPMRESVVANLIGDDVIAVHALVATVDEWLVQAGYRRLADRVGAGPLGSTLGSLLAVKRRHEEFFAGQARARLAASAGAARLARRRLRRTSLPLGSPAVGSASLDRLLGDLVTDSDLADIDGRLADLPGLTGLSPARRAAARAARRRGRTIPVSPPTKEHPHP